MYSPRVSGGEPGAQRGKGPPQGCSAGQGQGQVCLSSEPVPPNIALKPATNGYYQAEGKGAFSELPGEDSRQAPPQPSCVT